MNQNSLLETPLDLYLINGLFLSVDLDIHDSEPMSDWSKPAPAEEEGR